MAYKFSIGAQTLSGSVTFKEESTFSGGLDAGDADIDNVGEISVDVISADGANIQFSSPIDFNSQAMTEVNIDGGDIASGVVINKSPVITLGGDLTGNATLSNLGNATLTATIAAGSVEHGMLADDIISGQAELAHADIADADDMMISDNGTIKKVGVDSLRDHFFGVVSGDIAIADGGAATIQGGAVENAMLAGSIADSKLLQITTNDKVAGSAVQIATDSAIADDSGLNLKANIAGDGLALAESGGNQILSLDLNELTAAAVNVAADSIAIIDADGNVTRKESIADLATAMAGSGISASGGVLSASDSELNAAAIDVAADSIAFIDADDGNASKKESIADLATAMAGFGIADSNGVLSVSYVRENGLTQAAVDVAADSILIIDADSSNQSKKESITDLMTAVAGAGLHTGGSGVLAVQVSGAVKIASDKIGITGSFAGPGLSSAGGPDSISSIELDIRANRGLGLAGNELEITLANNKGLEFDSGALAVDLDGSGGLAVTSDGIKVNAGGVTDAMLAGSISNAKLANSTVSGIALGSNLNNLTAGDGLSGGTYNGGNPVTFAVDVKANSGLEFDSGELATKVDSNKAMGFDAQGLGVNLANNKGLEFDSGALATKIKAASGITVDADGLQVALDGAGGLEFNSGAIRLEAAVAGAGLGHNAGVLSVDATQLGVSSLRNDGLTIGRTGANGHNYIDFSNSANLTFLVGGNRIVEVQSNNFRPRIGNTIDLGKTGNKFRHLYLEGDIKSGDDNVSIFAECTGSVTIGSNTSTTVVAGNLTVNGTTTTINSTTLTVDDKDLVLASGAADAAAANGAGISIDGASATFTYAQSGDKFVSNKVLEATSFIGNVAGNATTATTLASARNIGGVSFNGSADINLPGVNQAGNQDTSGRAATVTSRTIGGVAFDASANIVPNTINMLDEENANADRLILFADGNGANQPKNDGDFHYNPSTGRVTATSFSGDGSNLTGVSASSANAMTVNNVRTPSNDGSGANALLAKGFNYTADLSSDGTHKLKIPANASTTIGHYVYVKAPSDCAPGRALTIIKNDASQTIDGLAEVVLESPHAAIGLVYVANNTWKII